jgi:hypothetical protein
MHPPGRNCWHQTRARSGTPASAALVARPPHTPSPGLTVWSCSWASASQAYKTGPCQAHTGQWTNQGPKLRVNELSRSFRRLSAAARTTRQIHPICVCPGATGRDRSAAHSGSARVLSDFLHHSAVDPFYGLVSGRHRGGDARRCCGRTADAGQIRPDPARAGETRERSRGSGVAEIPSKALLTCRTA